MSKERILAVLANAIDTSGDCLKQQVAFLDPPDGRVIYRIPEGLVEALEAEPKIAAASGQAFNQRNHFGSLHLTQIAEALIDSALEIGAEPAVNRLYQTFDRDYNACIEVAMLAGITVERRIELSDGVFLAPLRDVPSTTMQAYLAGMANARPRPNFAPWAVLEMSFESKSQAALYRDIEVRPKYVSPGVLMRIPDTAHDRLLGSVANLLVLTLPSTAAISRTFVELRDGELLKDHVSRGASWTDLGSTLVQSHPLTEEDADDAANIIRLYLKLPEKERIALDVPLHRLNEATRTHSLIDRALDLGIAFESLLLADNTDHNQLTMNFRLRGAWLLGNDSARRSELFDLLGRLYQYRSAAAHAGQTKQIKRFNAEADLQQGLSLCAAAIREVISRGGRPQWSSLLLGGRYEAAVRS